MMRDGVAFLSRSAYPIQALVPSSGERQEPRLPAYRPSTAPGKGAPTKGMPIFDSFVVEHLLKGCTPAAGASETSAQPSTETAQSLR